MATQGMFCWYELITSDAAAACDFYKEVVGWEVHPMPMADFTYNIVGIPGRGVGGIMSMGENGPPPIWMGYIAVDDVDAYAEKVKAAGGDVHKAPDDIPNVGRFAVCADPQGAPFVLFKGLQPEAAPAFDLGTPGTGGWNELHSSDQESAFAFYSGLFGWTKDQAMDMGPIGTYQLFAVPGVKPMGQDGGVGAMFNDSSRPSPMWQYYFCVDDIYAALKRVIAAGGEPTNGPHEVPGGAWILEGKDPQGALFALVGPKV